MTYEYRCDCGNRLPYSAAVVKAVDGTTKPVEIRAAPICCDGVEMHIVTVASDEPNS